MPRATIRSIGGIISTWSFLSDYAPWYRPGAGINACCGGLTLLLASFLWWWQKRQNQIAASGKHNHRLEGISPEEEQCEHSLDSRRCRVVTDIRVAALGVRHPLFVYKH